MPTQDELDALPADRRLELLELRHHRRHQWFNSLGIAFGAVFAALSLVATVTAVRTSQEDLRTSQQELDTAKEAQFTDRYSKTIEALASNDPSVRLGALHALGRLMNDSSEDREAIIAVLTGYLHQHRPKSGKTFAIQPDSDLEAVIKVLARRPDPKSHFLNLAGLSFPCSTPASTLAGGNLAGANLIDADLSCADLNGTDLSGANLHNANLSGAIRGSDATFSGAANSTILKGANLTAASLEDIDLSGMDLSQTNFNNADLNFTNLRGANLNSAWMMGADLSGADLRGTSLKDALLSGANLKGTDLTGSNLKGADLRGIRGLPEDRVEAMASSVDGAKFGP